MMSLPFYIAALSAFSIFALFSSCSSTQQKSPKAMWSHQAFTQNQDDQLLDRQKKWEKYELNQGVANSPYFFIHPDTLKNVHTNRKIASQKNTVSISATSSNANSNANKRPLQSVSERGLYFLALFEQYQTMLTLAPELPTVERCPSFHSALLEYFPLHRNEENLRPPFIGINVDWEKIKQGGSKNLALFPELALPLQISSPFPGLIEILEDKNNTETASALITKAIHIQAEKMHKEVLELCENGATENSYIFENTVTYLKDNQSKLTADEQLKIFMRLPLFSNLTLLKAVVSTMSSERAPAATFPMRNLFEQELLERLHGLWVQEYWNKLIIQRRQFI